MYDLQTQTVVAFAALATLVTYLTVRLCDAINARAAERAFERALPSLTTADIERVRSTLRSSPSRTIFHLTRRAVLESDAETLRQMLKT